jgi:RNA polymerase sigma-70 factor (ECF subfamily)
LDDSAESFAQFYLENFERVARAAYLVVGREDEAFDLAQEAFVRTWARWDRVAAYDNPQAFTLRVTRNLSLSHVRALLRYTKLSFLRSRLVKGETSGDVSQEVIVRSLLRQISPRQRWAVVLCDFAGFTSGEAAEIVGVRPATLRVHLSRGREALRELVAEESLEDSASSAADGGA